MRVDVRDSRGILIQVGDYVRLLNFMEVDRPGVQDLGIDDKMTDQIGKLLRVASILDPHMGRALITVERPPLAKWNMDYCWYSRWFTKEAQGLAWLVQRYRVTA